MARSPRPVGEPPGPFRSGHLTPKSEYELSNGHPVRCLPTGNHGGEAQTWGAAVIASDPAVERAGVDVGYSPTPEMLRAPDVSVIPGARGKGWVHGVPPLAIEYADSGQDEDALREKIAELLAAGTRHLWVVRLGMDQRVEVYRPGGAMRVARPGEDLEAEGVLSRPVPVAALFDASAAAPVVLDNLLRRAGYDGLDALKAEGRVEGRAEGAADASRAALRALLARRGVTLTPDQEARLAAERDPATLQGWLLAAFDRPNPLSDDP